MAAFLACFVWLFLSAGAPGFPSWASRGLFFAFDPLILIGNLASARTILVLTLWALIPLALTLLLGRFFCGWVCPFGALHEFVSWMTGRGREATPGPDRRRFRIKYLLLVFLIVVALAGTSLIGWLDPFALLTRSAAGAIDPAIASLFPGAEGTRRVAAEPVLIGSIFLLLIALSAWKRRFFCSTLCPLGALYGVVGRFGLMRIASTANCDDCGVCRRRCPYEGGPGADAIKSECVACLHCVQDCPREGVVIAFAAPGKAERTGVDLGRRRLLGTVAAGAAFAVLPKAALETRPGNSRRFMRPPGALREKDFLSCCVRCGQCIEVCPTSFIQPAGLEAAFEGIWTPVVNARAGYCAFECNRCLEVCPTGAIARLDLAEKKEFKIGTAAIDRSRCFTHADGFNCTVCVDRCPVPGNALRFRDVRMFDFHGREAAVRQVYVMPDLCTGCGICEFVCPRSGGPGITVTCEDEVREIEE